MNPTQQAKGSRRHVKFHVRQKLQNLWSYQEDCDRSYAFIRDEFVIEFLERSGRKHVHISWFERDVRASYDQLAIRRAGITTLSAICWINRCEHRHETGHAYAIFAGVHCFLATSDSSTFAFRYSRFQHF